MSTATVSDRASDFVRRMDLLGREHVSVLEVTKLLTLFEREILRGCDWYWPAEDTSSDACMDNPFEALDRVPHGQVVAVSFGGVVETRYYALLPPADDSDSDDEFEVDEPTAEAAAAKIAAEMARREASRTNKGAA